MSSERMYLALRLQGPLQSWGCDSQYNRRTTGLLPTRSAITGMCCAASGFARGSEEERNFLEQFRGLRMTAIAIPRHGEKKVFSVRRLQDYHTVGGGYDPTRAVQRSCITATAQDSKPRIKNGQSLAVVTHRQYLADATFGVLLVGDVTLLSALAAQLANPVWGLWLGRKCCLPTAPVLAGLRSTQQEALALLIGNAPLSDFTCQEEVADFGQGRDSLPDMPVSFQSDCRQFSLRRVTTIHPVISE